MSFARLLIGFGLLCGGAALGIGCHRLIELRPNLEILILCMLTAALALAVMVQLP
jgi:hypothetical protein